MRLVRKGWHKVPARIHFEDGLWQAEINGAMVGPAVQNPLKSDALYRIWEHGRKITQAEYEHALTLKVWAEKNDPTHPAANPRKPIDLTEMNPLWRTE